VAFVWKFLTPQIWGFIAESSVVDPKRLLGGCCGTGWVFCCVPQDNGPNMCFAGEAVMVDLSACNEIRR